MSSPALPSPPAPPASIEELQALVAMLQKQLKAAGVDPDTALLSLDDIKENLQAATRKLMAGDERAQPEFDKWEKILSSHPEHIDALERAEVAWEDTQRPLNDAALAHLRALFPPDLSAVTKDTLESSLGPVLAKRITHKPVLRMVTMDPAHIAKIHAADLVCKFAFNGLDLREVRALYSALPPGGFQNDSDGRKADWSDRLRSKLKGLVAKEASKTLRAGELIDGSYPDSLAKAKTKGRRKSVGGIPSSQNRSPNKKKNMLLLGQLLQNKTLKKAGPGGGGSESKGATKNKEAIRGRRNSIAAMLEGKLTEGPLKLKNSPGAKVSKQRGRNVSKVHELASAFKRAQQALHSAQAHKSRSALQRDSKTNACGEGKQSITPNRVPAKVINDLERRLSLSTNRPSPLTKQRAPHHTVDSTKINDKNDDATTTPPHSPHRVKSMRPRRILPGKDEKMVGTALQLSADRGAAGLTISPPQNKRFGCGGVFIPMWCLVLGVLSIALAMVWARYAPIASPPLGSGQRVNLPVRSGSLQQRDNDITDGSSAAFTFDASKMSTKQRLDQGRSPVGDTTSALLPERTNPQHEQPRRPHSQLFPVNTGSNLPCGISGRPNGLKGCVFSAATQAQQLKSLDSRTGRVTSAETGTASTRSQPVNTGGKSGAPAKRRKLSKHKAWMMKKKKEAEEARKREEKVVEAGGLGAGSALGGG
jgi:hypothetical protein